MYLKDEYAPFKKSKSKGEQESNDNEVAFDPTNYQLTNLTIQFEQLGWKVLCDEDEWKEQFSKVRAKFTQCVELSKIILPGEKDVDEDKQKRTWGMVFSDGMSNPYCRLSRNWLNCYHYLEKVTCLDPETTRLEAQKSESTLRSYVDKYLPKYKNKDTWIAMHRAYKLYCLVSKAAMASNPFGPFGGGMMGF